MELPHDFRPRYPSLMSTLVQIREQWSIVRDSEEKSKGFSDLGVKFEKILRSFLSIITIKKAEIFKIF